jgi:Uma2 family endonuclease
MIASAPTKLMTVEELYGLPDDGYKHELVRGELVKMPPPGEEHGVRANYIGYRLSDIVIPAKLGRVMVETGYHLTRDPDTVRAPDVSFVRRERYEGAPSPRFREGAPDLAVEIVSPGDTLTEILEKVQEYLTYGAQLVWVVEPKTQTVTVYRADGSVQVLRTPSDRLSGEELIPAFSITLKDLFLNL